MKKEDIIVMGDAWLGVHVAEASFRQIFTDEFGKKRLLFTIVRRSRYHSNQYQVDAAVIDNPTVLLQAQQFRDGDKVVVTTKLQSIDLVLKCIEKAY